MSFAHLSPTFFKTHPLEREFFQRFDGHYPWNEQVFPVYAWDDLVYIAAVDPETVRNANRAWPSHWILVQCDSASLAQAWMEMREDHTQPRIDDPEMHEVTSPPTPIPTLDLAEPTAGTSSIPNIPTPAMEPLSVQEKVEAPPTKKKAEAPVAVAKKQSEPVKLKGPEAEFDPEQLFASTNTKSTAAVATGLDNDDPFAAFGESSSDEESESSVETESSDESESSSSEEEMDGMPEGLEIPEGMKFGDGVPQGLNDSASAPEDLFANIEASLPPIPENVEPVAEVQIEESLEPVVAAVAPVASVAQKPTKAATAPKANPSEPEFDENSLRLFPKAMVISLLKQVPEDFTHMFFALKAGNSLRMTAWTDDFTPALGAEMDFSLSTPSPFRIALRTEKSYHGYLIESPYLDGFFKSWSQGIYPANLTVVPVVVQDQIYGFLIAFGNANSSDRKHLSALERKAIEAANLIKEASKTAQAS